MVIVEIWSIAVLNHYCIYSPKYSEFLGCRRKNKFSVDYFKCFGYDL